MLIALASTLSKALEWCIPIHFEYCLSTSDFQFGFKPGLSTTLGTGLLKNVDSHYLQRGSSVFACFLDAFKALTLSSIVYFFKSCLTEAYQTWYIVRFLYRWYSTQELKVHLENVHSNKFGV